MTERIVVMISGEGTNLQALIDAIAENEIKQAEIALVVSNHKDAYGLERAQQAGIETLYFPLKPYTDEDRPRTDYDTDLAEKIASYKPDLIVLAGWMHILSSAFLDRFPNQVINLHPALPGAFPGKDAIRRAFEAFHKGDIKYTGCMVHYVTPEVDAGEVIQKIVVLIRPDETLETVEEQIHNSERFILVKAVKQVLHQQRLEKQQAQKKSE